MATKKKAKKSKGMRKGSTVCKMTNGRVLCLHRYKDGSVRIVGNKKAKKKANKKKSRSRKR